MAAKRLPLWLVLVIGSILGLIGYGLKYLAITFHISFLLSSSIFAPTFIAGNSICWRNTVCYVAIIDNFPSHRQVLVGIITSYQGLSAKMFTDIVHAVMPSATVISNSISTKILPLVNVIFTGLFLLAPLIVIPIVKKVTEKFAGKWDKNTEKELCGEKVNGDVGKMEEGVKEREDDKKAP
uniref:Nodulin-like domain-containing protein n=1 Tax=Quercus lobata TaxID=97700 RepID=A0A7N2KN20_QUELO